MGVRVDRETALGWLGIEGYRPTGRVRPTGFVSATGPEPDALAVDEAPAPDVDHAAAFAEAGPEPNTMADHGEAMPGVYPASSAGDVSPPLGETVPGRPEAVVMVGADSIHRPLAEAIARVGGLACEMGAAEDCLQLGGEKWELSALAGDGQAKRRLWRALIAAGRRARS